MKHIFFRLVLFCSTLLLGIAAIEITIRTTHPQYTFSQAYRDGFDCYQEDALLPLSLKKQHTCRMVSFYKEYDTVATTNSLGYRGAPFSPEKKPGMKRVLALGDSFTFGIGVADSQTYPYLLEADLRTRGVAGVEVINAGFANGFSPDSYYLYYTDRGYLLKPDIVILGLFVWNDIADLSETMWTHVDGRGLPKQIVSCCRVFGNGTLHRKILDIKYAFPILRESHAYILSVTTIQNRWRLFTEPEQFIAKRDQLSGCVLSPNCVQQFAVEEEKMYRVLTALSDRLRADQTHLVVVLIPANYQVDASFATMYNGLVPLVPGQEDFIQQRLTKELAQRGIAVLDVLPILKNHPGKPVFFPHDGHFTAEGNAVVAQALSEAVGKYLMK